MKSLFAILVLVAALLTLESKNVPTAAAVAATAAPKTAVAKATKSDPCTAIKNRYAHDACENYHNSAAGDEYFGRMKMSYLGINNTFHDEAIRSGAYTLDQGIITKLNFADDALRTWASKYPGDPQLARSYFLAIVAYTRVYTQPAQNKAWQYMNILVKHFPNSYFGKLEKKQLQIGFTEHYFALALPCPTPTPVQMVNGRIVTPPPTPEPSPTDTPTPAPTPQPGQPKVQLITPDCVPATPVPTEAPTPTATEMPLVSPSPMEMLSPSPTPS